MSDSMKICITGANGFIGSHLALALKSADIDVVSLCRTPKTSADIFFNLTDKESFSSIPTDTTLIIHAAFVTQGKDLKNSYQINIDGTRALFNYAHEKNIKILFISSCSAHDKALSFYGKSKYLLEQYVKIDKDIIVRPGFVIGKGGIYKRLEESIQKLKCAPLFWGGNQSIQTIAIEILCKAILTLIQTNRVGTFNLVNENHSTIREFYTSIFKKHNLTPRFITCPSRITLFCLKILESLSIPMPITSENLLGLKAMRIFKSDLKQLGIDENKETK
jgi:NADH dehydrogenase